MHTLLVANRGEIARRIGRTARALGLRVAAVYTDADRDLAFVREADVAVRIGDGPVAAYLDVDGLVAAAKRVGADAVHPGYGFLSERAAFAAAVSSAGLVWVGPPAAAIAAMGDKGRARQLAASLHIPVVHGYDGDDQSDATFVAEAAAIGVPLLVKAAAGGGGRGMRRVDDLADLPAALASARREAGAAFGDHRLLLERYVAGPRHVEVQVLADAHGAVVHLGERECSIQRRHQKIVEESPSPAVDPALRSQIGDAACRLARAVGYVGAGTVELLVDDVGGFYFLEMNTRLQVEHPVTEAVTGLDLVEWQLRVAMGEALPWAQDDIRLDGWAIEARVYAEDPLRDYQPGTGTLLDLRLEAGPGVRVDTTLRGGDEVTAHYDPMIAKVIASGSTRALATARLRRALERGWAPGVATNLPLLRQILAHPLWHAAQLDTHFLARAGLPVAPPAHLQEGALLATAVAWARRERVVGAAQGFRVDGPAWEHDTWSSFGEEAEVRWRTVDADSVEVAVGDASPVRVVVGADGIEVDGVWRPVAVALRPAAGRAPSATVEDGDTIYLHFGDGEAMVTLVPRFPASAAATDEPGAAVAPTPGRVVAVHVAAGELVERGDPLVTVEAMKMEQVVVAARAGPVEAVRVAVGDAVDAGQVLVRVGEA